MSLSRAICFYHRGAPCNGDTPLSKPLGGTESAMIYMARALAGRGHRVSVFCEADAPGIYDGVDYRHWSGFEAFALKNPIDVFISVRSLVPLLAGRWASAQIYFSPDAYDQPFVNQAYTLNFNHQGSGYNIGLYSLAFAKEFADAVFCVGAWQAETFISRFRIPRGKVFIAHNGVVPDDFSPLPLMARDRRIAYCSTPFRGLEHLLRYFPAIRAEVPDAECAVMSGMQLYGMSAEKDQELYGEIYALADQPGVRLLGPMPKRQMGEVLARSRVLAYPNTFAETFCIAALEAQACGLPVVSTELAAMKERVETGVDGYLIPGHPSEGAYRSAFVEKTVALLTDDSLWARMSAQAAGKAAAFDYADLALKWESKFESLLSAPRGRVNPFRPKGADFEILVGGYPRKISLSAKVMTDNFCQVLREYGFIQTAKQVFNRAGAAPDGRNSAISGP